MNETKTAFAERTKRCLKKNLLVLHRRLRVQVHSRFVSIHHNLISWKNCSIDLKPSRRKNFAFLSFLYSKAQRENKKPKFEKETEFASQTTTHTSGMVRSHSLRRKILK